MALRCARCPAGCVSEPRQMRVGSTANPWPPFIWGIPPVRLFKHSSRSSFCRGLGSLQQGPVTSAELGFKNRKVSWSTAHSCEPFSGQVDVGGFFVLWLSSKKPAQNGEASLFSEGAKRLSVPAFMLDDSLGSRTLVHSRDSRDHVKLSNYVQLQRCNNLVGLLPSGPGSLFLACH